MPGERSLRPTMGCAMQLRKMTGASMLLYTPTTTNRVAVGAASFSTTTHLSKRKTKDSNRKRGVSSLYRSGPREPLSMSQVPLPKPRTDFKRSATSDESHGLWGFFPAPNKLMWTPKEMEQHGRAWTVEELRRKSWEDLHALWWTCCRERNMLSTTKRELSRARLGFGEREIDGREEEVTKTMKAIKHALTERYYTWEDATEIAESDPEIDLRAEDGQFYKPSTYEEEQSVPNAWAAELAPQQSSKGESPKVSS